MVKQYEAIPIPITITILMPIALQATYAEDCFFFLNIFDLDDGDDDDGTTFTCICLCSCSGIIALRRLQPRALSFDNTRIALVKKKF